MLKKIIEKTSQYIENMPKKERKKYGQFFTSMETAQFMASMFVIPKKQEIISVLDAGAGSGILSCAMIERLDKIDEIKEIELTCYETDENVLPLLKGNLSFVQTQSCKKLVSILLLITILQVNIWTLTICLVEIGILKNMI